jgi:hypothetical protein
MGQQQLLLVILALLIVGIATMVGITIFGGSAVEATRNAIIADLGFYAQRARQYYWKPVSLGGGSKSFEGITIKHLTHITENENARYYIEETARDYVVLVGVGKVVSGEDSIRVKMRVNERQNQLTIVN